MNLNQNICDCPRLIAHDNAETLVNVGLKSKLMTGLGPVNRLIAQTLDFAGNPLVL